MVGIGAFSCPDEDCGCEQGNCECEHCSGTAPCCLLIEINGFDEAAICPCRNCEKLNGDYKANKIRACTWRGPICADDNHYPVCGDRTSGVTFVRGELTHDDDGHYYLNVYLESVSGVYYHFRKDLGTSPPDCNSWDVLDVPFYLKYVDFPENYGQCDHSAAICRVTSILTAEDCVGIGCRTTIIDCIGCYQDSPGCILVGLPSDMSQDSDTSDCCGPTVPNIGGLGTDCPSGITTCDNQSYYLPRVGPCHFLLSPVPCLTDGNAPFPIPDVEIAGCGFTGTAYCCSISRLEAFISSGTAGHYECTDDPEGPILFVPDPGGGTAGTVTVTLTHSFSVTTTEAEYAAILEVDPTAPRCSYRYSYIIQWTGELNASDCSENQFDCIDTFDLTSFPTCRTQLLARMSCSCVPTQILFQTNCAVTTGIATTYSQQDCDEIVEPPQLCNQAPCSEIRYTDRTVLCTASGSTTTGCTGISQAPPTTCTLQCNPTTHIWTGSISVCGGLGNLATNCCYCVIEHITFGTIVQGAPCNPAIHGSNVQIHNGTCYKRHRCAAEVWEPCPDQPGCNCYDPDGNLITPSVEEDCDTVVDPNGFCQDPLFVGASVGTVELLSVKTQVRPSLFRRLGNFTVAGIKHVYRGSPTCTDEEIAARHDICRKCPSNLYLPDPVNPNIGTCTHPSCGCPLNRERRYVSKLSWADSECPMKHWLAIARS